MDSSQKRARDRKRRQRLQDKADRRKDRAEQKLQRQATPESGSPETPDQGSAEPKVEEGGDGLAPSET